MQHLLLTLVLLALLGVPAARAGDTRTILFLPDGSLLTADPGRDAEVRLWKGGRLLLRLPAKGLSNLAVSSDGKKLGLSLATEEVRFYELPSGRLRWSGKTERPRKREAAAYFVSVSPNGRWLLTRAAMFGDSDPFVRLWADGKTVFKLPSPELPVLWTSDNRLVRVDGATAYLWGGESWQQAKGLQQDSPVLDLAVLERAIVTLSSIPQVGNEIGGARAWFWDLATGKLSGTLEVEGQASGLRVSADGTRVLVSDEQEMRYQLWDVPGKRLLVSGQGMPSFAGATVVVAQPQSVRALRAVDGVETARLDHDGPRSLSPDGRFLAAYGLGSGPVTLWDLATGARRGTLSAPATAVAFSPDGSILALGLANRKVVLYDTRTLKALY